MRPIGFSTGAIARGDLPRALHLLAPFRFKAIELSALRLSELPALVDMVDDLDLQDYRFISVHAPSRFPLEDEGFVVDLLDRLAPRGWPIIVHPDVIYTPELWAHFDDRLYIENGDKRKPGSRTTAEISAVFDGFPAAGFCFDVAHARQVDTTMTEAYLMLKKYASRLSQVHISELNSFSRHDPLSSGAIEAIRTIARLIPTDVPIILETPIDNGQSTVDREIRNAVEALTPALRLAI